MFHHRCHRRALLSPWLVKTWIMLLLSAPVVTRPGCRHRRCPCSRNCIFFHTLLKGRRVCSIARLVTGYPCVRCCLLRVGPHFTPVTVSVASCYPRAWPAVRSCFPKSAQRSNETSHGLPKIAFLSSRRRWRSTGRVRGGLCMHSGILFGVLK